MKQFDVAIVGAGPAGSSAAITLAQRGYHVALFDRAVFPRDKLCGDFVNPINWPVLDELGVSQELLACPHAKISIFRMTSALGSEAISDFPEQNGRQFGLGVRRFHLDHSLLARAERAGVSVHQGARITDMEMNSRGWRLSMERSGETLTARARLIVGADGRNSWVARRLGVRTEAVQDSSSLGFEIQLQNVCGLHNRVEIHQFPGGYGGIARVDEVTANLCFTVRRSCLPKALSFENLRHQMLGVNPSLRALLLNATPVSELRSVWPVYFPARPCFGERFLLVGDAARVSEPVTGEGIYLALRSGQLAALMMADALRADDLAAARLAEYHRACRAEFGPRLRLNMLIRFLMYQPRLLSAALRLFGHRRRWLAALVRRVCLPQPVLFNQ
jgi:menaquinone-9 beta-reductase